MKLKWTRLCVSHLIFLIGFLAFPPAVSGQSLFERRSALQVDQCSDYAARGRGDLLSVLIAESTDVANRDERSLDKTGNTGITKNLNYGFGGDLGDANGTASIGDTNTATRGFSGDTEFRSARQFTDKFTVQVIDVQPNGNLLISGTRTISLQGDQRELKLTGIVRQFDVLPNNSIPSYMVANLKIELEATGTEQAFNNQGWLSKKVNKIWPF